jgi:putative CocE/NonD family hydrolase
MGRNEWTDRGDWSIPGAQHTNFYLHGGTSGSANSLNDGTLSTVPPHGAENPDSYTYDPANLVPSRGGNTQTIPNGAFSQRDVEVRCLTFTSEPLTEEIEATGHVSAVLYAASSALDTDWVVRVTDVHPDGHSRPIADGILRARYRAFSRNERCFRPARYTNTTSTCGSPATHSCRDIASESQSQAHASRDSTAT